MVAICQKTEHTFNFEVQQSEISAEVNTAQRNAGTS